jgi:hypothetical protein
VTRGAIGPTPQGKREESTSPCSSYREAALHDGVDHGAVQPTRMEVLHERLVDAVAAGQPDEAGERQEVPLRPVALVAQCLPGSRCSRAALTDRTG